MLVFDKLLKIDDKLFYLPSEKDPVLSSDIGVFFDGNFVWLYDCGSSENALKFVSEIDDINLIISHFHRDHCLNLTNINNVRNLYVGRYTYKHVCCGNIIEQDFYCGNNSSVHIFPIPNSHCKGSLAMEIEEKYVFLGDSAYGKEIDRHLTYNAQLVLEQYKILCNIKADKCIQSHNMGNIIDKQDVLAKLDKILSKRRSNDPLIIL